METKRRYRMGEQIKIVSGPRAGLQAEVITLPINQKCDLYAVLLAGPEGVARPAILVAQADLKPIVMGEQ